MPISTIKTFCVIGGHEEQNFFLLFRPCTTGGQVDVSLTPVLGLAF